jgi:hypothetical protein
MRWKILYAVWLFDDTKMGRSTSGFRRLSFFGGIGAGFGKDGWFLVFGACASGDLKNKKAVSKVSLSRQPH